MNLFKLSWKNLISKPLSMALCLMLVALGVALTSMLSLLNVQLKDRLYKNIDGIHMVVGAKGGKLQMILSSVYHIGTPTGNIPYKKTKWLKKSPYVSEAIPITLGDTYKSFRIVGTDSSFSKHYKAELASGDFWKKDMEVTLGSRVAKKLGLKIGDEFHGAHGLVGAGDHVHETYAYVVVGILKPSNTVMDQLILTNLASTWRVHEEHDHEEGEDHNHDANTDEHNHDEHNHDTHDGHDHDGHDHNDHNHNADSSKTDTHKHEGDTAKVKPTQKHDAHNHDDHGHDHHGHDHGNKAELPPISEEGKDITAVLIAYAKDNEGKTSAMAQMQLANFIDEQEVFQELGYALPAFELGYLLENIGFGSSLIYVLIFVITFVSGFSVFISLYNSMKERRYEVALMRTMGASKNKLFFMVTLEGLMIAFFGFLIGMLISHGGMMLLAGYLEDSYQYSFTGMMFLVEEAYLFLGAILIGLVAAIVPAMQAYRIDISKTLAGA